MNALENRGQKRDAMAVASLFGVAVVFALVLLIGLPLVAKVDPVGANVMKHRLRAAHCKVSVRRELDCLQECALVREPGYKERACELLPTSAPTTQYQQRLESELWDRSPCAKQCQTCWKTHALWCGEPLNATDPDAVDAHSFEGKAVLAGIDACIFDGATLALFEHKESRCRQGCPDSDPTGDRYLSSGDGCMVLCLLALLVPQPDPHQVRQLVPELAGEPDVHIEARSARLAEPPVPTGWRKLRHDCRLQHVRAVFTEPLQDKRAKEHAYRDCVRARLDAP